MSSSSDHMTLRDYLRTVRRHRLLVVALTVLGGALALALAFSQPATYTAHASVAVRDLSQDYAAVGLPLAPQQTQLEISTAAAQTTTTSAVASRVKQQLGSRLSIGQLQSKVSTTVDQASNFVIVQADDRSANSAATLANAFAQQSAAISNHDARTRFATEARSIRAKIAELGTSPASAGSKVELESERARFLALSNFAQPASVVEPATVPSSPSSPKPVFDAVLGSLIGFILAILIAFGRQALDRRLQDAHEIGQLLELPMIGDLRSDALGRSPNGEGARGELSAIDLESVRIIRRNLDFLSSTEQIRTVAITSPLPEEGKSTLATALAYSSAAIGRRTLLIECDLRRAVIAERLGLRPKPGLADYLLGDAEPADVLQVLTAAPGENGSQVAEGQLVCIVAGTTTSRTDELLSSVRFRELLEQVSSVYDLVVLDSAPLLPVADTLEILPFVDSVLLCVRARQTTRDQALAARAAVMRLPPRPIGVVLTAVNPADEYGSYAYSYAYDSSSS